MPLSGRSGGSLGSLSDVNLSGAVPGDVLVLDASGIWLPASAPPPGPHTHDAADVTTGVFVNERLYSAATVSTTDATATLIATIATTGDSAISVLTEVQAHRTGGTAGSAGDGAILTRRFRIKREAGVVTVSDLQSLVTDRDQASWTVRAIVLGTVVRLEVIGAANNNIDWQAFIRTFEV